MSLIRYTHKVFNYEAGEEFFTCLYNNFSPCCYYQFFKEFGTKKSQIRHLLKSNTLSEFSAVLTTVNSLNKKIESSVLDLKLLEDDLSDLGLSL